MAIETSASLARFSSIHPATSSCACIVSVRHDPAPLAQVDDLTGRT
jgi:hypothetical protein